MSSKMLLLVLKTQQLPARLQVGGGLLVVLRLGGETGGRGLVPVVSTRIILLMLQLLLLLLC